MSSRLSTDVSNSLHSSTHAHDVEKLQVADAANTDTDIVDWDGPDDPENPQNWQVDSL
jgi:hypothetical protein